jgi:hypothetical protein
MSDTVTVDIDTSVLSWKIDELARVMRKDPMEVFKDEMRLLNRTIVNFIPPSRERGGKGAARAVGEAAVERQLKNLISEADPELIDTIGSQYGIRNINAYITKDDGSKLELRWENLDPTGSRLPEYHARYRNRAGRIPNRKKTLGKWASRVVVPWGVRKPYIEKKKGLVGFWKATWAASTAAALGDTFPAWISRHYGRVAGLSVCKADFSNPDKFSFTFGSRRTGNYRFSDRIRDAVAFRSKTISRRIKLILSEYNKETWQNMRRRTQAIKRGENIPVE